MILAVNGLWEFIDENGGGPGGGYERSTRRRLRVLAGSPRNRPPALDLLQYCMRYHINA
jgi:hypothetical protein